MKKELQQVINDINKYKTVPEVTLVGVSKTRTIAEINKLVALGITNLGENRPQELRDKYDLIKNVKWHMIGRLQENKIKYVIERACLIHSGASLKLIKAINKEALKYKLVKDILIQINTSDEESKQGFNLDELADILIECQALSNINVVGLMVMAPLVEDDDLIEETFKKAKEAYDLYQDLYQFKYLSMGMSHDYRLALKCGANMLRIGSLLFEED
ncbi:MAG: YggS family pyridoxal phosphate-dependent enzyme [Bacilli bacterium]|jgi:pyridoxal phosphate enzyme (YggS family)|nr:YggS family pyridoxal phosphate-dependent enzyme [Bacilli bacterium]